MRERVAGHPPIRPKLAITRSFSYDSLGRPQTQTYPASPHYPAGLRIRSDYTAQGYLAAVRNDATNALYYQVTERAASGELTQALYGNGVSETLGYESTTGRLTSVCGSLPLGVCNLDSLAYGYDALGNLTERQDIRQGNLRETFLYDGLNRLTETRLHLPTPVVKTMAYDILGNLVAKTGIGTYEYTGNPGNCAYPGGIHAVKRAGGQSTCYDANGNELTSWNYTKGRARSFTWTSANLVKTITENAQIQTFWYDASGNRFKETNTFNGETALLLGNYLIATTGPAGPKS